MTKTNLNEEAIRFDVKGWCPGALRPMESGDGWIVRMRPRTGALSLKAAQAIGEAAERFGNGHIDVTRRANLQIRGVREESHQPLLQHLGEYGLLDADSAVEAARNLLISPLAGLDPKEALDMRPIAEAVEISLSRHAGQWRLPAKFGFIFDGNGALPLTDQPGQMQLVALAGGLRVALGVAAPSRTAWLGSVPAEDAATTTVSILDMLMRSDGDTVRVHRHWSESAIEAVRAMPSVLSPLDVPPAAAPRQERPLGCLDLGGDGKIALAVAAPFGRIEAAMFLALVSALSDAGVSDVRLSPWRAIYAGLHDRRTAQQLCEKAFALGFIVDADDPLRRVEACPGAPACRATIFETRADARKLSELADMAGFSGVIHVSGCAKGCARTAPADLVLVGGEKFYGIIRKGTARDTPSAHVAPDELNRRLDIFDEIG